MTGFDTGFQGVVGWEWPEVAEGTRKFFDQKRYCIFIPTSPAVLVTMPNDEPGGVVVCAGLMEYLLRPTCVFCICNASWGHSASSIVIGW